MIRNVVKDLYNAEVADSVRILYGGSVKPETIEEQMSKSDIDGALVGGASNGLYDWTFISSLIDKLYDLFGHKK